MSDEDREFMASIVMVLVENKMIMSGMADAMDLLSAHGLYTASNAADILRVQVAKIDSVLGGKYKGSRDEIDTNTLQDVKEE